MQEPYTDLGKLKQDYKGKKITILSTISGGSHLWLTLYDIQEDENHIYFIGKKYGGRKLYKFEYWKRIPIAVFNGYRHFYYATFDNGDFIRYCYSDFYGERPYLLYDNNKAGGIEYKGYAIMQDDNSFSINQCAYWEFNFTSIDEAKKFIDAKSEVA